jgi:hypothetical protein
MHSIFSIRRYQFAPQTHRDPVDIDIDITFVVFVVFAMLMMKEMVMKRWPKSRHRSNTIFLCCQKYTFFVMLLLLIYSPFVEAALSSPSSSSSSPSSNTYNTSKIIATATTIGAAATAIAAAVTAHDQQDAVMRDNIEEGIVYDSGTSMQGKKRGRTYKEDVDKDKRGKKAAVYLGTTSKGVGDEPSSLTPRPAPLGSYPSPLFYDDKSSINSSSTSTTRGLLPEVANAQPSSSAKLLSCVTQDDNVVYGASQDMCNNEEVPVYDDDGVEVVVRNRKRTLSHVEMSQDVGDTTGRDAITQTAIKTRKSSKKTLDVDEKKRKEAERKRCEYAKNKAKNAERKVHERAKNKAKPWNEKEEKLFEEAVKGLHGWGGDWTLVARDIPTRSKSKHTIVLMI